MSSIPLAEDPVHKIEIRDDAGTVFRCSESQRVLVAMEQQGLARIPVGCRGGGCGVCKVKVDAGAYVTGRMSRQHITEDEERDGYALACKLFPRAALVITICLPEVLA